MTQEPGPGGLLRTAVGTCLNGTERLQLQEVKLYNRCSDTYNGQFTNEQGVLCCVCWRLPVSSLRQAGRQRPGSENRRNVFFFVENLMENGMEGRCEQKSASRMNVYLFLSCGWALQFC